MPPPRGLVQQLDHTLHRRALLKPGERVLIACSGGADSVALLRLLHAVNQSNHWHWTLLVAHVDHGLRGKASARDLAFVRALANSLQLPFFHRRLRLRPSAGTSRVSEETARDARRAALLEMARRVGATAVALGHHADDQAETILMRLLRGCGVEGLAGIVDEATPEAVPAMRLVRPLLGLSRSQLRTYLQELGQTWREDATNASSVYLRNRIRHELLPLLETYQPRIRDTLGRLGEHAGHLRSYFSDICQQAIDQGVHRGWLARPRRSGRRRTLTADKAMCRRLPRPVLGRLLQRWIADLGGSVDRLDYEQMRQATEAVLAWRAGTRLQFSQGILLRIASDRLWLVRDTSPTRLRRPVRTAGGRKR